MRFFKYLKSQYMFVLFPFMVMGTQASADKTIYFNASTHYCDKISKKKNIGGRVVIYNPSKMDVKVRVTQKLRYAIASSKTTDEVSETPADGQTVKAGEHVTFGLAVSRNPHGCRSTLFYYGDITVSGKGFVTASGLIYGSNYNTGGVYRSTAEVFSIPAYPF